MKAVLVSSKEVGVQVDAGKTKSLFMSSEQHARQILAQDTDTWRALVNTVMNQQVT
jgi:hypothetical protein